MQVQLQDIALSSQWENLATRESLDFLLLLESRTMAFDGSRLGYQI
jgi:hypothetical protein